MTCFRLKNGVPLSSHCRRRGIPYSTCYRRIELGDTVEEALAYAYSIRGKGRDLNNCQHYLSTGESLRSVCMKNGIRVYRCYRRMLKKKISPDEALKEVLEVNGKKDSFKEELRERGLPSSFTRKDLRVLEYLSTVKGPVYATDLKKALGYSSNNDFSNVYRRLSKEGFISVGFEVKKIKKKAFVVLKKSLWEK